MNRDDRAAATAWSVLGTPLLCTDYDGLAARCRAWVGEQRVIAIEFANVHIVTLRRHERGFREESAAFDVFLPDGAPVAWCLNRAGADIRRAVCGPTFMGKMLAGAAGSSTHYLLGGSEECGQILREKFTDSKTGIRIIGGFHGMCGNDGTLEGEAEKEVIDEINRLAPDYIWVGFGGSKQVTWLKRHKHLLRKGVILGVGFAFDVNAGVKRDAPEWMQRNGLTWLFRLCSEPRRLAWRYVRYNSLFLSYLLLDGVRGCAVGRPANFAVANRGQE